jgi:hypothetical protein
LINDNERDTEEFNFDMDVPKLNSYKYSEEEIKEYLKKWREDLAASSTTAKDWDIWRLNSQKSVPSSRALIQRYKGWSKVLEMGGIPVIPKQVGYSAVHLVWLILECWVSTKSPPHIRTLRNFWKKQGRPISEGAFKRHWVGIIECRQKILACKKNEIDITQLVGKNIAPEDNDKLIKVKEILNDYELKNDKVKSGPDSVEKEKVIASLQEFAKIKNFEPFSGREWNKWSGKILSEIAIRNRFGGKWKNVLAAAGIQKNLREGTYNPKDLMKHLEEAWRYYKRPPSRKDLESFSSSKGLSLSHGPYETHWGSIKKACIQFSDYKKGKITEDELYNPKLKRNYSKWILYVLSVPQGTKIGITKDQDGRVRHYHGNQSGIKFEKTWTFKNEITARKIEKELLGGFEFQGKRVHQKHEVISEPVEVVVKVIDEFLNKAG